MKTAELAVIILLLLPAAWSVVMTGLRRLFKATVKLPQDAAEKCHLMILIAPVALGALMAVVAPLIHVSVPLPVLPATGFEAGGAVEPVSGHVVAVAPVIDPFPMAAFACLIIYSGVTLWLAVRLALAQLHLHRLAGTASAGGILGQDVRLTSSPVPPLAWGHIVLLPRSLLVAFDAARLDLVIRHERVHVRRGDGRWFGVLAWIEVLFWFNPLVRNQARRCRLAAELACDAAVLAAAPEMRRIYAETLVRTLKHTAGNTLSISTQSGVPAAFSPDTSGDYRMRLKVIMHPPAQRRKPSAWLYAMAAILAVPLAVGQLAWSQGAAPGTEAAAPAKPRLSVAPVAAPVTSAFGDRLNPMRNERQFHSGVDFAISVGTEVHTAGDGTISNVDYQQWGMGHIVEIDHGGGVKTRYAHLEGATVKAGDHVIAGQVIATSGDSGLSTGPHLHFEVWQDGQLVDPASVLPLTVAK